MVLATLPRTLKQWEMLLPNYWEIAPILICSAVLKNLFAKPQTWQMGNAGLHNYHAGRLTQPSYSQSYFVAIKWGTWLMEIPGQFLGKEISICFFSMFSLKFWVPVWGKCVSWGCPSVQMYMCKHEPGYVCIWRSEHGDECWSSGTVFLVSWDRVSQWSGMC